MSESRRRIPRTDRLLADPRLLQAEASLGRGLVKAAITRAQARARDGEIPPEEVADAAVAELPPRAASLTPVINATGIVVHTNLGRAPLSQAALAAIAGAGGNCDLEFDLATGARSRQRGQGAIGALLAAVPGAAAAGVVNNNAAALVLAATVLAAGREIIISRGELIEIGARFRLPDLLESTGARLREVGTTNRTNVEDYADAIGPDTGFILKVHPSNYRIEGFTAGVGVRGLAALSDVPVVHDIGSGLLAPDPLLPDEPDAATSLKDGANLVTASGDKLLGGPQAGLLLGDEALVRRLLRHPLARALRVGKLTLAALEATLTGPPPPVAAALRADAATLLDRAERLVAALTPRVPLAGGRTAREGTVSRVTASGVTARAVPAQGAIGGGGAPGVTLPGAAVALPEELAVPLRNGAAVRRGEVPAVVGRIEHGNLLLDLRSVAPEDDELLITAISAAVRTLAAGRGGLGGEEPPKSRGGLGGIVPPEEAQ
ncbi:MAG TPA: L-seryl-tRNA(Sec) selenium transferase [Trebonia sp.]